MAKLIDAEGKNKNIIKAVIVIFALVAIFAGALVHYNARKTGTVNEATQALVGIHVKGAVENPGYIEVPFGTRVLDLDSMVGFLENADTDGVNLAEYVTDGEEVYIPFKASEETGAINLNTVSYKELSESVEGIGSTYAGKIIEYREAHGKFSSVTELKSILNGATYKKVYDKFYVE